MSTMEYVESLPQEEQDAIQRQYEHYVKGMTRMGKEVIDPETWLTETVNVPVQLIPDYNLIRKEFKRIMIDAGHGSITERAFFQVKGI